MAKIGSGQWSKLRLDSGHNWEWVVVQIERVQWSQLGEGSGHTWERVVVTLGRG